MGRRGIQQTPEALFRKGHPKETVVEDGRGTQDLGGALEDGLLTHPVDPEAQVRIGTGADYVPFRWGEHALLESGVPALPRSSVVERVHHVVSQSPSSCHVDDKVGLGVGGGVGFLMVGVASREG
jgi:hypothetical protein